MVVVARTGRNGDGTRRKRRETCAAHREEADGELVRGRGGRIALINSDGRGDQDEED